MVVELGGGSRAAEATTGSSDDAGLRGESD